MYVWNFTFGSHLSSKQYSDIISGDPIQALPAVLSDHRLTFWPITQYPESYAHLATGGGPALIPEKGSLIYGVAYQVTQAQYDDADHYEQVWGYYPFKCQVIGQDGIPIDAMAHNLTEPGPHTPPADSFLGLMLEGLAEHGYEAHIIEGVRKAAQSG